jgi:hypothetical protein
VPARVNGAFELNRPAVVGPALLPHEQEDTRLEVVVLR